MPEAIATEKLVETAMKLLPTALNVLTATSKARDILEFEFQQAHIDYCTSVLRNYCKARTFFVRDEPQYLEEFYVPTSLLSRSRGRISRANLDSLEKIGPHIIVSGTGGSGKTIFMRYLLLDSIERAIAYPVLLELRSLNEDESTSLEDAIVKNMIGNGFPIGESFARKALAQGQLVLLLDGFDEVNSARRKKLVREIKRIATSTDCRIVISSRPDITLEGWDLFSRVGMAPLELEEACELVEKIKFDDDEGVKTRFISSLRAGLFESHRYFLSNPLLLSIMLLTYGHSADIPKRFTSFYERAYTALFEKHDAYKGYRRERETDLDMSEFSALFAAFSTITYDRGAFRFTPLEAMEYVTTAKRLSSTRNVSEEGFINDAKQAICLLVDDGLDLAYVHRSFQEYFAAKYIHSADRKLQRALIERYGSTLKGDLSVDNVLKFLHEMSPAIVEEFYLIPALQKAFGEAPNRKLSLTKWRNLMKLMFSHITRSRGENYAGYMLNNNEKARGLVVLFAFIRENYGLRHFAEGAPLPEGAEALAALLPDDEEIQLDDLAVKDPLWAAMAEGGFYSIDDLDRIRIEFVEMLRRGHARQETDTS